MAATSEPMRGGGKRKHAFSGGRSASFRLDAAALAARPEPTTQGNQSPIAAPDAAASAARQSSTALAVQPRRDAVYTGPGPSSGGGRRGDGPDVRRYHRGQADVALAIARDPSARARATAEFENQIYAKTSTAPREARKRRWEEIAGATGSDPYDFTPALVTETMAVLWAADYRTTVAIAETAKAEFLAMDGQWTGALDRAFRNAKRAAQRGLGPSRHTAPFPWERLEELEDTTAPRGRGGPLWPRRVDTVACWWLLREIEAGNATVNDVRIEDGCKAVFTLPASKSDPAALGVTRTHRCACGRRSGDPGVMNHAVCPACQLIEQVAEVRKRFGPDPALPLFPTEAGTFVTKGAMIESIKAAARELGLPLVGHAGAELWGGHAWRRGGAQGLARAGVEVWRIQALARHSSAAILAYVEGAHVSAMTGIAAEAALGRSLAAVREELAMLTARVAEGRTMVEEVLESADARASLVPLAIADVLQEPLPAPPPAVCAQEAAVPRTAASYVVSLRRGGKVHTVDPAAGRASLCGWNFRLTTEFEVSACPRGPPRAAGAPKCAKCARREAGVGLGAESSSGSDEVVAPHGLSPLARIGGN